MPSDEPGTTRAVVMSGAEAAVREPAGGGVDAGAAVREPAGGGVDAGAAVREPAGGGVDARAARGAPGLRVIAGRGEEFDWRAELSLVAPDVMLPPGCAAQSIAAAEGSLGVTFPAQLAEFLKATDGVYDPENYRWFAWSLERIVDENFEPERPPDLLLVGDDAGSGWFCVPLAGGGIVHYDRAATRRRTIAADLRSLWLGWFGGTLRI